MDISKKTTEMEEKKVRNIEDNRIVRVFLDDEEKPFGEFNPPVEIMLDTTKIPDGQHTLKIVAKSTANVEGVKIIPFEVKNGPEITVMGLKPNQVVDKETSITINAYGSENEDQFIMRGSEDPKPVPAWFWALLILVIAFGIFYLIMYWTPDLYKSPF